MFFFFQAEDGIRDLVRSRGLGDVYKRQAYNSLSKFLSIISNHINDDPKYDLLVKILDKDRCCLLYTSDAADERSSVDLGGRRIIKKKKRKTSRDNRIIK